MVHLSDPSHQVAALVDHQSDPSLPSADRHSPVCRLLRILVVAIAPTHLSLPQWIPVKAYRAVLMAGMAQVHEMVGNLNQEDLAIQPTELRREGRVVMCKTFSTRTERKEMHETHWNGNLSMINDKVQCT